MTDAPADLTGFVRQVRTLCGFTDPNEVGMLPNAAHLRSGGFHCGVQDIKNIGKYPDKDYSTRQPRDRVGGNASSAVDVGDNWPRGGRAAWLRFNNALVAALKAADPELAALRGVNFSPDGSARKRYDTNSRSRGVINSTDTVTIHTHLEFWRNTAGTPARARACARILQLMTAAITGAHITESTPTSGDDDMLADERQLLIQTAYRVEAILKATGSNTPTGTPGKTAAEANGLANQVGQALQLLSAIATAQGVAQQDLNDIQARTGVTDAQASAMATTIADKLVASAANGLTAADHAAIVADVKTALTQGTGA